MYIFYDTETSGLDRGYAQVLQVGLMVTDDDLNIIASKKLDCRRSPWVVPSPGALLITGFTPEDLKNSKNSSFEMMREIDQWVRAQNWPVIFAGYNSLGYDEDVLAHNLNVNMLDPGLTQSAAPDGRHNSRFDVLNAVQAVMAYMPGALKLDVKSDKGNAVLKLSTVAEQNGVALGAEEAHDAFNDIKATVGVAKVVKATAPEIWDQMHVLATQGGVDEFMSKHKVFTHTAVAFGKAKPIVTTSVAMRGHRTEILFDLSQDPGPFLNMTVEQLKDVLIAQTKKPAKNAPPVTPAFRFVRKDLQPVMMPLEMSEAVLPSHFDEKLAEARADAIKAAPAFQENLRLAAQEVREAQKKPPPPAPAAVDPPAPAGTDTPASGAAPTPPAKPAAPVAPAGDGDAEDDAAQKEETLQKLNLWKAEFQAAPSWTAAAALAEGFAARFEAEIAEDPYLAQYAGFGRRIVFEHAPEALSQAARDSQTREIAAHVLCPDEKAPWMTIPKARGELEKIEKQRAEGDKKWAELSDGQISALKTYYAGLEAEHGPFFSTPPAPLPAADNDNDAPPAAATPKRSRKAPKPK